MIMKTTAKTSSINFGIRNSISIILVTVLFVLSGQQIQAENNIEESNTILIEAATMNEVAYGFVKCKNGVSTTEIKKGIVKSQYDSRSTKFDFEHDQNVEINFKLKIDKNGTFKWRAKNSNPTEELSLLGLEQSEGIGNSITFIAENKSYEPKTIIIEAAMHAYEIH